MLTPGGNRQDGLLSPQAVGPHGEVYSPAFQPREQPSLSLDIPLSVDANRLRVQHEVPRTPSSIDGDTLRPRSESFASASDTITRSRAGSDVTMLVSREAYDDVPLSGALTPDPRNEQDFLVKNNKFAFSPGQLNKMLNPKSLAAFQALGGLRGLERGLRTNLTSGLSEDETLLDGSIDFQQAIPSDKGLSHTQDATTAANGGSRFEDRIRIFSQNRLPARKSTGFLKLLWQAYNDKIIILLTIAAIVSLSLGIYETVDAGHGVDWIEGVAICVAILIVTVVTAANDWQKERQFAKLNKRNNDREVKAVRSGKVAMISIFDITVGDVLHLEPGDSVPADGILISGHGIKCDESSATGESDQMKKINGDEVWQRLVNGNGSRKLDPFMISGSKVLEGVGTYLVTSVGPYSSYGRILLSLQETNDPTPLQVKLGKLANWIGWLGSSAAIVLFFALFFRFVANLSNNPGSPAVKGKEFVDILIVAVTVIVVAIPEGLPLAVTLALAFATTRMVKENNLVRVLRACETMGNATVICSDKTGTLTQNKMTVVAGTFGTGQRFSQDRTEDDDDSTTVAELFKQCSTTIRDLIIKSIALNSTAFEEEKDGAKEFIGSKTEVALLQMAKDFLGMDVTTERASAEIVQLIPFDSSRKCMGVVCRDHTAGYRLLVKGAAEIMVSACSSKIVDLSSSTGGVMTESFSEKDRMKMLGTVDSYAEKSLRTIGLVYRDFPSWPPKGARLADDDSSAARFEDVFCDMTWVGIVGIQDPLRPEVPAAIQKCHMAGVQVKMVTGDNIATATAIASSCGIKTEDGIVMEGPKFRQLSDSEMDEVIPRLQVLARSSPEDKRILVARLKKLGETVAVTGDGTNDGPALKTADVGFSMGIAGTEVAKEASSIILLDDNFKSIVTAIAWGRAVNDAVAKFLQFQITVNITAVVLTFVSSLYSKDNRSVLTAVQLLWVNLIMDTFAALALATDAPTEKILDRKPVPKSASLFTVIMWKMIIGQAIYQLAVTFMLYFVGDKILSGHLGDNAQLKLDTIVFNTFVWMQIFNEFNNRRLDNKLNIFEGMFRNYWFLGINCIMIAGQVMIIYVGGAAFGVTRLDGLQWGVCIICAIACLPWAVVLRLTPDRPVEIAIDVVVRVVLVILRPVGKLFSVIKRMVSSMVRPAKRFSRRIFRRNGKQDDSNPDEDESPWTDLEQQHTSKAPPTPVVVPPITITTS
ncbi:putative calcium-translocating P-type ATPase(PMCA-type) [Aspergillus clavatus NRRL 1]|uniref:Calcium-transporting ATPase n=1 Tax=Aspergillus clavatus (strain ATCC 1007 / CBS 513.65 / DSM 816 / NCTC 3887 / NRRL 1 / QM 1276 / 107) TaxID=344612 RepID=A1CKH3_ASPCL|nr:calcium-translocating P-type ATPase(PMCA-type),putative [Aspergillus clavatus NRRL 1]EAW09647.1 calcium-translocating P-type ATPase(PMCA-type),putative [Aspergillus clavatus NRRL 1]